MIAWLKDLYPARGVFILTVAEALAFVAVAFVLGLVLGLWT